MARVKFIRDEEPNIRSLETNGGVVDGALYVATDTGTMWMGTGASTLLQIKDNIDTNTWNALKGATSSVDGTAGYVPAPTKGAQNSFLRGDATWRTITKSTIGLGNVDNTADADKSVKYATSAGSANTASVANSVAWDNITGAPTIPIPETTWKDVKTEGQFYKSDEAPSSTTVGKYDGYFYATRVYNAVYNDYAELFHCVRPISVGHLAYATKEGVTCAGKPKTAIGIVSDCYGHLLGGEGDPDDPNFVPIAVAGRVPLEIKGNIEIGDMVQATKNGLGKRAHRFTNRNKIIGKAVGFDPKGRNNYMEVLVGGM